MQPSNYRCTLSNAPQVWGYGHQLSKLMRIRDMGRAFDPPGYTLAPDRLLSFELQWPDTPEGFSEWADLDVNGNDEQRAARSEVRCQRVRFLCTF